jgi:hypothetical protein
MKSKSLVWCVMGLMTAVLTIPRISFARVEIRDHRERQHEHSRDERRHAEEKRQEQQAAEAARHRLEGTWYLNGDRDKPCQIVFSGGRFEAKNELGATTRLVYDRYDRNGSMSIRANDWEGGLHGEVRQQRGPRGEVRQSIEWANGTRWTRFR